MFTSGGLAHFSIIALVLVAAVIAYDASSHTNIVMYYGQGPGENELGLSHFCDSTAVDIIPLGFMNRYIAQANGYPGTNFGGSCWADNFTAPGYNGVDDPTQNDLKMKCPTMVSGIPYCQSLGKKILLSLGGQVFKENSYALTSVQDAEYMADFLWGAFGPLDSSANWPRPFDTEGVVNEVDGFDFDIEHVNTGEQGFYVVLIKRLRNYFVNADKEYIITGAPQCNFPDAQMGDIINEVQFDMLFIQYYDTPECSAREWVTSNPGYGVSTNIEKPSGFKENFDSFVASLPASKSKDVKLYIGLLGSTGAGIAGDYLDPATEAAPLIKAHFCNPYVGGIMIFDAGHSEANVGSDGKPFYEEIKDILIADSTNTNDFTCATTGTVATSTTAQVSHPTGSVGTRSQSMKVTTLTMTLCPSGDGFATSTMYQNSTATAASNYTSALYPNSTATRAGLSASAVTSTILPFTRSTAIITKTTTKILTVTSCEPIYGDCAVKTETVITESQVVYDTVVRRAAAASSSSTTQQGFNSSSTLSAAQSSNQTMAGMAATPTYSFNYNGKSSSTAAGTDCFVVIMTVSIPVTAESCTSTPSATSTPSRLERTSGSAPLSMGSSLFFAFSVGVPGTFGVFWYILGRVVL